MVKIIEVIEKSLSNIFYNIQKSVAFIGHNGEN